MIVSFQSSPVQRILHARFPLAAGTVLLSPRPRRQRGVWTPEPSTNIKQNCLLSERMKWCFPLYKMSQWHTVALVKMESSPILPRAWIFQPKNCLPQSGGYNLAGDGSFNKYRAKIYKINWHKNTSGTRYKRLVMYLNAGVNLWFKLKWTATYTNLGMETSPRSSTFETGVLDRSELAKYFLIIAFKLIYT